MSTLKLTLIPNPENHLLFNIHAENYGTENSKRPFFDEQGKSNLATINKKLDSFPDDLKIYENIGKQLYQALFPGNIKIALYQELGKNEDLHIQIQYDFRVTSNSNLSLYPWNLVHDGNDFLAKNRVTFSYRILDGYSLPSGKRQIDKLKVLVISSQASETEEHRLLHQESLINDSLQKAQNEGRACLLSWYEPQTQKPTYKTLRNYLTDNRKQADKIPDIIHFNGHGVFKDDSGFLLFENEQGKPEYISAEHFSHLIEICNPKPQLIVLTACYGALAHNSNSVFNGVAQKLLQKVPAVVATPFSISQDSTTDFIEQFYRVLGNSKSSLLDAVKFASQAMKYKQYEWYRLVLFLRHDGDKDGYLFEFEETSQNADDQKNKELDISEMETLKDLLKRSGKITSNRIVRKNFCKSIGINIYDITPDNLDNLNDDIFIDELFDFIDRNENQLAVGKLLEILEKHFQGSLKISSQIKWIKGKLM
ncbi:CHAT domain-containing protein [Anabaena sp. UHCC 0451]|uniref:CHAT domain-containing protein n=1 Tax=Anabaena sp. UHCC 0451 TaxID=2055235 RepID=UPI002B1F8B5E|nr:CHAT domain-containing protein [Anabaena sp. UHCC 0451]MEA5574936.1 CHAT domain-containing protein [Anabaena sp. UHCC 0451]